MVGSSREGPGGGARRQWLSAPDAAERPVQALIIGHITRDLLPQGGWRPGGAAYYAGVTAHRLGLRVGVVTSAPADICAAVCAELDDVALIAVESGTATTFENVYTPAGRVQYLRASAQPLTLDDIPQAWRRCEVALLAPVANELAPDLAAGLTARIIGAAPQGWLRAWGADGRVHPRKLDASGVAALRRLSALILSREDLTGPAADAAALASAERILAEWTGLVPLIVVTRGSEGAELRRGGAVERFPGYPARELDPTGAGDVFAATFLCALAASGDAAAAVDRANRVAALSVEGLGAAAIPTPAQVATRYATQA